MPEVFESITKMIPMGYSGDPEEDIAPVVLFLASEGGRYVTGNTIHVDGGGHINGVPWKP
jgi:NAD(P)-dependent dehydrogenase (short-subunit alcohol dehydrogenase family)